MKHLNRFYTLLIASLMIVSMLACSLSGAPRSSAADPTPDVAALVEAEVARQLAQQATPVPVIYGNEGADLDLQATLVALYTRANPAVVSIIVGSGNGSGFVYDTEGHIVTNSHVIANGRTYEVVFYDGARAYAELVGADADSDLAVLKVETLPDGVMPLALNQDDALQVGQFVVAIGNPFGEQGSMTLGIISGLGRSLSSQRTLVGGSSYSLPEVIQTDAPINPGNSGGPLLNLAGEVVGINTAIASTTGYGSGVGFSIPVAAVRRIAPQLITDGKYTYPYMGISFDGEITLDEQQTYGLSQTKGAYILALAADGPAAKAGLIAADPQTGQGGDLVIALDAEPINNFNDLNRYLSFHTSAGQTIEVTVLRNGETLSIPLTLGERP